MPCAGDYTKELAREGLMLSVDINTESSTIYCLLPLIYREQVSQPRGRDSWALRTEQRTTFHTETKAGALRCDGTGSAWWLPPGTVPSLSSEPAFRRVAEGPAPHF